MKLFFLKCRLPGFAIIMAFMVISCGDDDSGGGPDPTASFSFEVNTENTLEVAFTNSSVGGDTYTWDFGNGDISHDKDPIYAYPEGGTYTVTFTTTNTTGGFDIVAQDVSVIEPVTAEFTFEISAVNSLMVTFINTSERGETYAWDFGDGGTSTEKDPTYTYSEGGTYNVSLIATKGTETAEYKSEVTVTEPVAANIIVGGDMADPDAWTITKANYDEVTDVDFTEGQLIFSNTEDSQTHVLVWQAVEVEAGDYIFSADVSGTGEGALNSWMQMHFSPVLPVEGVDYNEGQFTGINTWDGCMNSEFSGNLALIGCKKVAGEPAPLNGKEGAITFSEAGTIYVVFKTGSVGGYLGTGGVVLDNVILQKAN